ncbi:MAG: hypothetical protein ACRCXZ_08275 [Patescibacteria group bacterium]
MSHTAFKIIETKLGQLFINVEEVEKPPTPDVQQVGKNFSMYITITVSLVGKDVIGKLEGLKTKFSNSPVKPESIETIAEKLEDICKSENFEFSSSFIKGELAEMQMITLGQ